MLTNPSHFRRIDLKVLGGIKRRDSRWTCDKKTDNFNTIIDSNVENRWGFILLHPRTVPVQKNPQEPIAAAINYKHDPLN